MPSRMRHGLLISLVVISLIVVSFHTSYTDTTNYIYDELNRLIRVEYEDGTIVEYTYDAAGNRLAKRPPDTTPPTGTITINSGDPTTNNPAVTLTLTCSDNIVCSQMQFSNDNVTYSPAEAYGTTKSWTLSPGGGTKTVYVKFKDEAENWSTAYSDTIEYTGEWLLGWSYRKSVTLSRPSGAVSNYQMKLLVGESSGAAGYNVHCNGHVLSSFNDLRITKSDKITLLDYWIESITGTTPNRLATVWIKFDSIGTGATTFYMYYGRSDATAYSNGDNTFIFFDDFPGTTINTDKWGLWVPAGGSSITVASSIAKVKVVVPAGANAWTGCILYAKNNWNRPFAVRAKWKEYDSNNCWAGYYPFSALYKDYNNQIAFERNSNNSRLWVKNVGATRTQVTSEYWGNDSNYHILDFMFGSSAWSAYIDGTQKVNANSENTLLNGCSLRLQASEYYQAQTSEQWFDYVFVRNYVSSGSEPAWGSWGAEQAN
jgi:YD repeat-containing protein